MTYWAINSIFLTVAVASAVLATVLVARGIRRGIAVRSILVALVVVLVMTAVFDNVMIGVGLVAYDPSRISGAFIGIAPLEDFAYAIGAVILLPSLWIILGRRMSPADHAAEHA